MSSSAPTPSNSVIETSDYVISIKYPHDSDQPSPKAQFTFQKLIEKLEEAGFHSQVRPGETNTLLVFVKAKTAVVVKHLKSLALKDYVYGLKTEIDDDEQLPENLTVADKLRVTHSILTNPTHEGGIGITPGSGDWDFVEKIIPLYDYEGTDRLLTNLLTKILIDENDILKIKELTGEKVALYFAYARFYFIWLFIPTVLGLISHLFFKRFSVVFTILNSLWAIIFINAWKKKQSLYAIAWGTEGTSKVEIPRAEYVTETIQSEPKSALDTPAFKRTIREFGFLPVALFGGLLLLSYQFVCFFIEIFLNEIYQGPGKALLGFVPTILIVVGAPYITKFYTTFIKKALVWENHETQSTYDRSFLQKLFVHNFLSSYAPLFITIFFYLPFGHVANSYLPFIQAHTSKFGIPVVQDRYEINNQRLLNQFQYFAITNLVVGFLTENVVPLVLRLYKEKTTKETLSQQDATEEVEFLKSVRKQVSLPAFDVDAEYRELVINFGYLVVFGPVWSLAPLFSLVSAYVEIKGDLEKLLLEASRPVPVKVEDSEPWATNLKFLTWLGTIVGPIITAFFRQSDQYFSSSSYTYLSSAVGQQGWKVATAALVGENISIFLNFVVESIFKALETSVERKHHQHTLKVRRSYVEAYARQTGSSSNDRSIDPTEKAWEGFDSDSVIKQGASISASFVKSDASSVHSSEKADLVPTKATSGYQQFSNDDSTLQARGKSVQPNAASKTVPATSTPSLQSASHSSKATGVSGADIAAIGSSVQAESSKNAPEFKVVSGDVKNGDYSSAKALATNVKKSPNEYVAETKEPFTGDQTTSSEHPYQTIVTGGSSRVASPTLNVNGINSNIERSSSPSISGSLNGATLPPDFGSKKSSSASVDKDSSPVKQHVAAVDSSTKPSSTSSSATSKEPETKTLDPVAQRSGISNTASGLGLGSVAASVSGIASKTSRNGFEEQPAQETVGAPSSSFLESAKEAGVKTGSTLNEYVQLGADKVEEYAAKSDNAYVQKGNSYVQKVADKSDQYAQKLEHEQSAKSQATSPAQAHLQEQSPVTTPQNNKVLPTTPAHNAVQQFATKPVAEGTKGSHTTGMGSPFIGDTSTSSNLNEVDPDQSLKPPSNSHHDDVRSVGSGVSSPKKKGFLKGLKEKVKHSASSSAHTTPKK